ncbi:MAG: phosphoglycerate kinase [Synergistaceae bacterium]|nr:phosphoglycerate kinase [Synergistaceae bacterium]
MKLRSFTKDDISGKKVLVRVDFNVPLKDGSVADSTRILAHKETVSDLLKGGARVALCSHLGRPKGKRVPEMSLSLAREETERVYEVPVKFCDDCIGPSVTASLDGLGQGELLLLENLRFYKEEQENDVDFARKLAEPFEVFVMDAFSASHRADASTSAIMGILPSFSGSLLQREVEMLSAVSHDPKRPFVLILGGAKVSDKIGVIENLMDKANSILIGGGMAFTFIKAMGGSIGNSLLEEDRMDFAREMLERAKSLGADIILPVDVLAGTSPDAERTEGPTPADEIPDGLMGLDIGPRTVSLFNEKIASASTILWNGPMGVFENPLFSAGTEGVAREVVKRTSGGGVSIVGGGDTAAAARKLGFKDGVSHVSTGGGASLEFCEGKSLPGIAPLVVD